LAGAARFDAVAIFRLGLFFWLVEALRAAALPLAPRFFAGAAFFAGETFSAPSCGQPETAVNRAGRSRNKNKNRLHITIGFSLSPYDSV
jgi:hypothetical protein